MKRVVIAAIWIATATVPLLMATVFLIGCCVLPFHRVVHRIMPICHSAAAMLAGHQDRETPIPAKQKEAPPKRIVSARTETFQLASSTNSERLIRTAATSYRSFITLGAIRCDRDVGLHVFVDTFRI
jgi:hypothetical protein